jgi:hypothetical protein
MQRITLVAVLALLLTGTGCSKTKLVESWSDPAYTARQIDRIAVTGIGANPDGRNEFEQAFSNAIEDRGNDAVPLHETFANLAAKQVEPDSLAIFVERAGCDLVLTARVVGDVSNVEFVEGGSYKLPATYYNSLPDYHEVAYSDATQPGRFSEAHFLIVETNVYDARSEKLIWASRSETTVTGNLDKRLTEFATVITEDPAERGLIR